MPSFFQITVAQNHDLKSHGLVKAALAIESGLSTELYDRCTEQGKTYPGPCKLDGVSFIWVVPEDTFASFAKNVPISPTALPVNAGPLEIQKMATINMTQLLASISIKVALQNSFPNTSLQSDVNDIPSIIDSMNVEKYERI